MPTPPEPKPVFGPATPTLPKERTGEPSRIRPPAIKPASLPADKGTSEPFVPQALRPSREIAASPINWESLIGANWLNRIGVLVLLIAGAFLAHLAWQRGWFSPAAQTAIVFVVGIGLLAAGEVFQRRALPIFAQGLTSLGILAL